MSSRPVNRSGRTRREFIAGASTLSLASLLSLAPDSAAGLDFGQERPFSFDGLRDRARQLAAEPYRATPIRFEDVLHRIDYDAYQQIRFRPEHALWADGAAKYPVQLFHLGRYFKLPVGLHVVRDGRSREILYSPTLFSFGNTSFGEILPPDIGFAGFRVMAPDGKTDWLAFLGAAYFRSSGELDQYGQSARGVAIDTAMPTPEEFPRFTEFWLEAAPDDPDALNIYTLMDGPSIAGAFRMRAKKAGAVVMDMDAALFARSDIQRLGIAPLTSMFWYSETNRHQAQDWRPEIHDTDGLAIWTGAGERIWRPLNNPPRVQTSSFVDNNPKGFGLLQRDRAFHNYEDDGVFYDRRPSVWVEPLGDWGEGAVQLVEIPTDDEIHDNIVAYWVPRQPVKAGSAWDFRYRLHWVAEEPHPGPLARVIATRLGKGGVPGQPRPPGKKKIVIDFAGGPLEQIEKADPVKLVVSASRGTIDGEYALQIVGTKNWRAVFDLEAEGPDPIELRAFLRLDDRTLTESWLYQFFPFQW